MLISALVVSVVVVGRVLVRGERLGSAGPKCGEKLQEFRQKLDHQLGGDGTANGEGKKRKRDDRGDGDRKSKKKEHKDQDKSAKEKVKEGGDDEEGIELPAGWGQQAADEEEPVVEPGFKIKKSKKQKAELKVSKSRLASYFAPPKKQR